jgi:predicted SnoaL-like aldol condensation-catalyzing enzyme
MSNKETAISFLKMAGGGHVQMAFDRFVSDGFKHHNQYFKGDRQSLMHAMADSFEMNPNKTIDVRQVYEDGPTVITHSLVMRANGKDLNIVVVHIFRFENGKIAEMWDLGQPLEKESPNTNGPF